MDFYIVEIEIDLCFHFPQVESTTINYLALSHSKFVYRCVMEIFRSRLQLDDVTRFGIYQLFQILIPQLKSASQIYSQG